MSGTSEYSEMERMIKEECQGQGVQPGDFYFSRHQACRKKKTASNAHNYDSNLAGQTHQLAEKAGQLAEQASQLTGPKRPQNGPKTGGWRTHLKPLEETVLLTFFIKRLKNAHLELKKKNHHIIHMSHTLAANPLAAKMEKRG